MQLFHTAFLVENGVRFRSFTSCHSSLKFNCRENWDATIKVSKNLALPVSSTEDSDRFEGALETDQYMGSNNDTFEQELLPLLLGSF